MRRRKKKPGTLEQPNFEQPIGWCVQTVPHGSESDWGGHGICGAPVVDTPSGSVCCNGHGGCTYVNAEELQKELGDRKRNVAAVSRELTSRPGSGLEVRDGDRLTVMYQGAKLQIAPYSTVEIDASIYSRTLVAGDDAGEQWDRVYTFLERKVLEGAREKLRKFAAELREAKERAGSGG